MMIFGDCVETREILEKSKPDLELHFRLPSTGVIPDLHGRYGDIVAKINECIGHLDANEENRVVMVINELVANALKYRERDTKIYVKVSVYGDCLIVEVHNTIVPVEKSHLAKFLITVMHYDLNEAYYRQIEYLTDHPDETRARLGVITILRDCDARLGYIIDEHVGSDRVVAYAMIDLEVHREN